jgi:hypothetical protein
MERRPATPGDDRDRRANGRGVLRHGLPIAVRGWWNHSEVCSVQDGGSPGPHAASRRIGEPGQSPRARPGIEVEKQTTAVDNQEYA